MQEGKITIGTVCFIIDETKQKVLMLERANEPMQNMFTGVGGKTGFAEDIQLSCCREVNEETGFDVENLRLKGVIKTVLEGQSSSWILFVYITNEFSGKQIECPEGKLMWVDKDEVMNLNLIGFIREIMPQVFDRNVFIEGTIVHDKQGRVLEKTIITL